MTKFHFLLPVIVLISIFQGGRGSAATNLPVVTTPATGSTTSGGGGSNPVVQLAGYVKDSVVRTIDGCGMLYKNHQKCNSIRAKQRDHRDKLQMKLEMEGRMSKEEIKQQLKSVNGGITYDEFSFLVKGKEDRGKLMNVGFLMWGAPKFLPYALMFYPEMLPSPFSSRPDASGGESLLEKVSRQRSHAVLQTLLNMENDARQVPALSKINIFGKKAQQQRMDSMKDMGALTSKILTTPYVRGPFGAQVFLDNLSHYFYRRTEFTRAENRLIDAPKSLITGLVSILDGPSPLGSFIPNFMNRGKIISHLKKISDCDEFLVSEGIDLESLDSFHLTEACTERLIGGPGRSDKELRDGLSEWLRLSVVEPASKLQQGGLHYNANLAKFSLLCYNALDASRDERSASYLPRTLFQGQIQDTQRYIAEDKSKKNKN